jgi:hypothetical protein
MVIISIQSGFCQAATETKTVTAIIIKLIEIVSPIKEKAS